LSYAIAGRALWAKWPSVLGLIAIFAIGLSGSKIPKSPEQAQADKELNKERAFIWHAQSDIRAMLKDPDSAVFGKAYMTKNRRSGLHRDERQEQFRRVCWI
jgi:hypothetical protein